MLEYTLSYTTFSCNRHCVVTIVYTFYLKGGERWLRRGKRVGANNWDKYLARLGVIEI